MSEQYGGPWNSPGGSPQPSDQPAQGSSPQPYGQATAYGMPPSYPSAPNGMAQPWSGTPFGAVPLRSDYAPWTRRVGAYLIDFLPGLIGTLVFYVGYGMAMFASLSSGGSSLELAAGAVPMIVGGVLLLLGTVWNIYNRWLVGGRTGRSLGKRVLGLRLVGDETGEPLGPLNAFLRDLVHVVDGFAYVGFLWPLWDERKQTFADKIIKSVVVSEPRTPKAP